MLIHPPALMESRVSPVRRSNSATAANLSIITLVGYLTLVFLKPILMPLAVAILLFVLIRAPEPAGRALEPCDRALELARRVSGLA